MTRSFPEGTPSVSIVRDVRLTCGIAESSFSGSLTSSSLAQARLPQMRFARCSPGYTTVKGVARDVAGLRRGNTSDRAQAVQARSRLSQPCNFMPLILRTLVSREVQNSLTH